MLSRLADAASSAAGSLSKMVSGQGLPFELGAEVTSFAGKTPWRLYAAKKERPDGTMAVSAFIYDMKTSKSAHELAIVRNALKRLRTMKHPYMLNCIEGGELPDGKGGGTIYLLTEPVQPLDEVITTLQETPGGIAWGIYTLAAAIKFLNIDSNIVHGQVCPTSIFVDKGMDWKLGGFELLVEAAAADEAYFANAKDIIPKRYQSPELARSQGEMLRRIPVASDWWALGCTVFEVRAAPSRTPSAA